MIQDWRHFFGGGVWGCLGNTGKIGKNYFAVAENNYSKQSYRIRNDSFQGKPPY